MKFRKMIASQESSIIEVPYLKKNILDSNPSSSDFITNVD